MKRIYVDNNIVIDVKNTRNEAIKSAIESLDKSKYKVVYSPAHIEEVAVMTKHYGMTEDVGADKLSFLAKLTDSTELLPYRIPGLRLLSHDGVFLCKEHPKRCYERVVAGYSENAIAEEQQKDRLLNAENLEEITNVTSQQANNIDTQSEIDLAKPRIHQILLDNYKLFREADLFEEYLPAEPPGCNDLNFKYTRNFFPIHEILMEKIFEYLENRRFYPEKSEKHITGLHDVTHAIYAAYCDIFVTNDRKLREKTKAAYKWLGIETLVLSRQEFVEYMSSEEG